MKQKELINLIFEKDKKDCFANVDIGLLNELSELVNENKLKKGHKSFTFTYYWLSMYLWKYSKYGLNTIKVSMIKVLLGRLPEDSRIDYITKKDGLLDNEGLTQSVKDFPIITNYSKEKGITISLLSELSEDDIKLYKQRYGARFHIKLPTLAYQREGKEGLLFSQDDVLKLSIHEFKKCMLNEKLGCDGFFVYAYIKQNLKLSGVLSYGSEKIIFMNELEDNIHMEKRKIRAIIKELQKEKMVYCEKRDLWKSKSKSPVKKDGFNNSGQSSMDKINSGDLKSYNYFSIPRTLI